MYSLSSTYNRLRLRYGIKYGTGALSADTVHLSTQVAVGTRYERRMLVYGQIASITVGQHVGLNNDVNSDVNNVMSQRTGLGRNIMYSFVVHQIRRPVQMYSWPLTNSIVCLSRTVHHTCYAVYGFFGSLSYLTNKYACLLILTTCLSIFHRTTHQPLNKLSILYRPIY